MTSENFAIFPTFDGFQTLSQLRQFEYGVDEKKLLTVWLADKVLDIVENEDDVKSDAIRYVQKVIKSGK